MLIFLCRSLLWRNGRKRDKNQEIWIRNEEVMQVVVMVTTVAIYGHNCINLWSRPQQFMVATMESCLQQACSVVVTIEHS